MKSTRFTFVPQSEDKGSDAEWVLIPNPEDVRDELEIKAIQQKQIGSISRIFNRAVPSEMVKRMVSSFCGKYVKNSAFQYSLDEFSIAVDEHKESLDSPYTDDGSLQPWVTSFLAPAIKKPLHELLTTFWKMAVQVIHDEHGFFLPWVYDFLGEENLASAINIFSLPVVREQLVAGVMQCIAGELGNVTPTTSMNETNFRMIAMNVVTQQNFTHLQCRDQQQKLRQAIDAERNHGGDSLLLRRADKVLTESVKLSENLIMKPNYNVAPLVKGLQAARKVVLTSYDKKAAQELDHIAQTEAKGKPLSWRKFFGALALLVGAAIITLGFLGIPFTAGASVIAMKVGGSLLAAGGATLFATGVQTGYSRSLSKLADTVSVKRSSSEEKLDESLLEMKVLRTPGLA